MSYWKGLWEGIIGRRPSTGGTGQNLLSSLAQNSRPPKRGTGEMLAAYNNMPRLRGPVSTISSAVSSTQWNAFRVPAARRRHIKGEIAAMSGAHAATRRSKYIQKLMREGELKLTPNHPVIRLIENPNPQLTARQTFTVIQEHLDLVGETFIILERDQFGMPFEMWPIPANWVKELPSEKSPFYLFNGPNMNVQVPQENIIWIKHPDPSNPYGRGSGLGASLDNELSADEYAAQTTSNRFYNNAIPPAIISMAGAKREDLEAFRAQWANQHRGHKKAGVPHLTSADLDVKQLPFSFVDEDLVNLRQFEADTIRETYGVPPEIVGDAKDSNRATIDGAQFIFALMVQVPRLDLLEDIFNTRLMPMFDEKTIILYENPVPEDREFQLKAAEEVPHILSLDEWRELAGRGPLGNDAGKKHVMTSDMVLVDPETVDDGPVAEPEEEEESQDEAGEDATESNEEDTEENRGDEE